MSTGFGIFWQKWELIYNLGAICITTPDFKNKTTDL